MSRKNYFKDPVKRFFAAILKIETPPKELIYAGIQVTGGAFLAVYTNENPEYRILPFMCSAIAVGGVYNVIKSQRRNFRKPFQIRRDRIWDLVTGAVTYSTGVYALSEGLKSNDKMWIPCLALAASGYYFTALPINNRDIVLNRKPFLKFCQLVFEPVLVACAATYLFYFRNHKEGWLKFLPFIATLAAGFRINDRGFRRDGTMHPVILRLKVMEMLMGSCLISISSTVLAIYSSSNDLFWPLTACMSVMSLYGAFVTVISLTILRAYTEMDKEVFTCTIGMIIGPVTFSLAFVLVECVEKNDVMYLAFPILFGIGQVILYASLYYLYKCVPRQVFFRYYQRVCGPILALYSCVMTAYIANRMGWRFSIVTMPFVLAGIYATYRGFRKEERTSAL